MSGHSVLVAATLTFSLPCWLHAVQPQAAVNIEASTLLRRDKVTSVGEERPQMLQREGNSGSENWTHENDPNPASWAPVHKEFACTMPPCCPAMSCVKTWTWEGKDFSGCTDEGSPGQYWCSEVENMNKTTLWMYCHPDKCKGEEGGSGNTKEPAPDYNWDGFCNPPVVAGAADQVCAESSNPIQLNTWCTPKCGAGKVVYVNWALIPAESPCGSKTGRGNKLCCGQNSTFDPPTFSCVPRTFAAIDKNADGKLSKLEWHAAWGMIAPSDALGETPKAAAAEAQTTAAPSTDGQDTRTIFDDPDFNPVIYFYVEGTALLFSATAAYLIFLVFKNAFGSPSQKAYMDPGMPQRLQVKVTTEHAGIYILVEGQASNGYPVWKHEESEFYIFSSINGRWLVGGPPITDNGMIASETMHKGDWPHLIGAGKWSIFDGKAFIADTSVNVIVPAPAELEIRTSCEAAGTYMLVPNQQPNGFPLWQRTDNTLWIFSGLAGQWFVGGETEQACGFVCDTGIMSSVSLHEGRMPDTVGAGQWMTFDGVQWNVDPSTVVVVAGAR